MKLDVAQKAYNYAADHAAKAEDNLSRARLDLEAAEEEDYKATQRENERLKSQ